MNTSRTVALFLTTLLSLSALAADVVFRKPFTLQLYVDKDHYYEETFDNIPYTLDGVVYVFKGDAFGIDLGLTNGTITTIT